MIRSLYIGFLTLLLLSCSAESEPIPSDISDPSSVKRFFKKFPDKQFLNIGLGEIEEENKQGILEYNYKEMPDQPNHFVNSETEIEIIFAGTDNTNEFKVFMYAEKDIEKKSDFENFLGGSAKEKSESDSFSVYDFETLENDFTITLFSQSDFLRLNMELKKKH